MIIFLDCKKSYLFDSNCMIKKIALYFVFHFMGLQSEHMAAEVHFVGSCVLSGLISLPQLPLRDVLSLNGFQATITNKST